LIRLCAEREVRIGGMQLLRTPSRPNRTPTFGQKSAMICGFLVGPRGSLAAVAFGRQALGRRRRSLSRSPTFVGTGGALSMLGHRSERWRPHTRDSGMPCSLPRPDRAYPRTPQRRYRRKVAREARRSVTANGPTERLGIAREVAYVARTGIAGWRSREYQAGEGRWPSCQG
jgi:hypothetical protein